MLTILASCKDKILSTLENLHEEVDELDRLEEHRQNDLKMIGIDYSLREFIEIAESRWLCRRSQIDSSALVLPRFAAAMINLIYSLVLFLKELVLVFREYHVDFD